MAAPEKAAGRVASVMQEDRVFPPPAEFSKRARIGSLADYKKVYDEAASAPEAFCIIHAPSREGWFGRRRDRQRRLG